MDPYLSNRESINKTSSVELPRASSQEVLKSSRMQKDSSYEKLKKDSTPPTQRDISVPRLSTLSDQDVSLDMFQKFQQSLQKQNIGPSQLKQSLEEIIKSIHVEQWKNIPLPVCIATTALLTCVNDLKRFSLYLENRFSNLTASTAQSTVEVFNLIEKFKAETEITMQDSEKRLNDKMIDINLQLDSKMVVRLAELKAESAAWAAEKTTQEINILKPWVGKVADDKIFSSERKQTADYMKRIKETKDMLIVPELIGPLGCPYPDFQDFAQKAHDSFFEIKQVQEQINADLLLQVLNQKQTSSTLEESISASQTNLQVLLDQNITKLTAAIKGFERQHEWSFAELSTKIKEQDLGQDVRVKAKLICSEWNEKITELELLNKNGQKFQKKLDQINDNIERIESQVAYQNTENGKVVYELQQQIEKQEQATKEVKNIVSSSPKGSFQRKATIKSSLKVSEQGNSKGNKANNGESATILRSSDKSSVDLAEKDEEKRNSGQHDGSYKNKAEKLRKNSVGRSSQGRMSGRSGSRTSHSSLKKKNNSKKETLPPQRSYSVSQTTRSRVQSAKPQRPTFGTIKDQEPYEQVRYDREINVTKNMDLVEFDDLTERVRKLELQVTKIQRVQTSALQKQEREKKKQTKPFPTGNVVDRTLAGILELGKFQHQKKPKSISNSPENRQQNAQLNIPQRGPLQWEAHKKKWVKEAVFEPDFDIKIDTVPELKSRSRSREQTSKNALQIRDQMGYLKNNFEPVAVDKSQDLYSAESNAYIFNKQELGFTKPFSAGILLNNPSHQVLVSDSHQLFEKRKVMSRELDVQSDEVSKYYQSVNLAQVEKDRRPIDILQSHAQLYYKQDGTKQDTKKRPLTGVRAQDLSVSISDLPKKVQELSSSSRKVVMLPQLKEAPVLAGSKQLSSKQFKLSSAKV